MRTAPRAAAGAATAAITLLLGLAGCGGDGEVAATPQATETVNGGTLTIGIDEDQPGLGMKDGDAYSGFDVETAKYVAAKLGVPESGITWVEAQPANRESLLEDGGADLVFSTYSITDARKQVVDFAGPYFEAHQDLLIRRNDEEITGPKTLDGRTLCSVTGTTSADLVEKRYKGKITLEQKPEFSDCVDALVDGDVDAVTTDDVILAGFAAQDQYKGKLKVVGDGFSDELYGVGIKKGDTAMVDKVNAALKAYIDDGSWKKNLEATVGASGYSLPDPPTVG